MVTSLLQGFGSMRRFSKQTLMLIASVDVNRVVRAAGADMAMVGQLVWSDTELGWIAIWRLATGRLEHTWTVRGVHFDEGRTDAWIRQLQRLGNALYAPMPDRLQRMANSSWWKCLETSKPCAAKSLRSASPKPVGPQNQMLASRQFGTSARMRSPVSRPSRSSMRT